MEKLTKEQAHQRFAGIKVYVDERSAEIQRQLFKAGFAWSSGSREVQNEHAPFLYTNGENGKITWMSSMTAFMDKVKAKVKAEDILNVEIIEDKPKRKVYMSDLRLFDAVLRRDYPGAPWQKDYFANYDEDGEPTVIYHPFGGMEVIPYEGNEQLLKTTNEPKED